MSWATALKTPQQTKVAQAVQTWSRPHFETEKINWAYLVSIDFETYYDDDYTLSKMSTSEYVRDPRFEALMMGIKVGNKKRIVVSGPKIKAFLKSIPWELYSILCHNTQFDGLILSHHFGVVPRRYYCSLSMARGLHSNEIGAGLGEVAVFYGRAGKVPNTLESLKGHRYKDLLATPQPGGHVNYDGKRWPAKTLYDAGAFYCGVDVDEMHGIFTDMVPKMPIDEMDLIDLTMRMFCDPVLRVDIPRLQTELQRELKERRELLLGLVDEANYTEKEIKEILKTREERATTGDDRAVLLAKKICGSNERFAKLLIAEGVTPPRKISPAWMKKPKHERLDEDKWTYAFAKDDLDFINLPDDVERMSQGLNLAKVADVKKLAARQARLKRLIDARLTVKSTSSVARAERFIRAGSNGMRMPAAYAYYRAHTGRWGGNDKRNMQNLQRGSELRKSILAALGHVLCVCDSGQIEARVNGWLWDQWDLLEAFRAADSGAGSDAYCDFASLIYGRTITKADKTERFVGKVCVLGLGFQMGAMKLQMTLAKGALGGPPVYFTLEECQRIINTYRRKNSKIQQGWDKCKRIIEDMAAGRKGSWKCISWEKDTIWLPNGMSLKYPDLKKRLNEDSGYEEWTYQAGDQRKKIYGGLLCENLVQALARIIVATQMLTINRKYRVVMTTHDEAVAHVKARLGKTATEFMLKVMRTPLDWCKDIPLNAEADFDVCYSK